MSPTIVIVEDDHLQADPLEEYLLGSLPDASVITFATEREFRENLPGLCERPPDVVVMDVMLRWDHPTRDGAPPPEDVAADGYYRAGLRCANLLLEEARLRDVPVVLYTILERSDLERDGAALPANSVYVGKSTDLETLSRTIRATVMGGRGSRRGPGRM